MTRTRTVNGTTRADLATAVGALDSLLRDAFAVTDEVAAAVTKELGDELPRGRESLSVVEPVALDVLTRPLPRIQGAGFVAAVGLLPQNRWWLEWFVREADDRAGRLEVQTDPHAIGFHDYERQPWYDVPRRTGRRHVTGPYVDNLCTQDYTLTFTQPLAVGETFLGVAGADVAVHAAEQVLLPVLSQLATRLALVNDDGRALASNTGALVCGELLPQPLSDYERASVRDVPLHAVVLH